MQICYFFWLLRGYFRRSRKLGMRFIHRAQVVEKPKKRAVVLIYAGAFRTGLPVKLFWGVTQCQRTQLFLAKLKKHTAYDFFRKGYDCNILIAAQRPSFCCKASILICCPSLIPFSKFSPTYESDIIVYFLPFLSVRIDAIPLPSLRIKREFPCL